MPDTDGGSLTTHVLDTATGNPAAGMTLSLYRIEGAGRTHLKTVVTNENGRCDQPLLAGDAFAAGIYELEFSVGDYLKALAVPLPEPAFIDVVPIRFGISARVHYHVPLLVSSYGYSTYRGS